MDAMGYNCAKKKMKKDLFVTAILLISMMAGSMVFSSFKAPKQEKNTENTVVAMSDDWTPIGTTEIIKMDGRRVAATQTVQVYSNSDGTRAIKDGKYYHEIEENTRYGMVPADECIECGYRYRVLYLGDYWYTQNIVKRTYGSY